MPAGPDIFRDTQISVVSGAIEIVQSVSPKDFEHLTADAALEAMHKTILAGLFAYRKGLQS